MHTMRIQQPGLGDETIEWDPADEKAVNKARVAFAKALKKGMLAYKVEHVPTKGEQIREFDPAHERIIVAAPLAGG